MVLFLVSLEVDLPHTGQFGSKSVVPHVSVISHTLGSLLLPKYRHHVKSIVVTKENLFYEICFCAVNSNTRRHYTFLHVHTRAVRISHKKNYRFRPSSSLSLPEWRVQVKRFMCLNYRIFASIG